MHLKKLNLNFIMTEEECEKKLNILDDIYKEKTLDFLKG